jgi:Tol biopolymer transport system component
MTIARLHRWIATTAVAAAVAVTASCVVPPPPDPPGPSQTSTVAPAVATTAPSVTPNVPSAVPGTPDGVTFLAGKPAPTYDNDASRAIISGDGKFVVFHHKTENLAITNRPLSSCPRPAATSSQVYRTNLTTGETVLVSVGTDGCYANGETTFPYTNDDGRYVVFMSFASNLVAGDTNARSDIFLKDMNTGVTTRISLRQNGGQLGGPSNRPSINGPGNKIVFNSNASNIVVGDTNAQTDCFLYDVSKGAAGIERISLGDNDQQLNGYNFRCDIAGDADAVVWVSDATNVMTGLPGTPNRAVYVRDLAAGTTELISKTPTGGYPTKTSTRAAISANGRFVVYQSTASEIIAGDPDTNTDIFRYDRMAGQTVEVSVTSAGTRVAAASTRGVISGDGRYVAFVSNSGKLVSGDRNKTRDVFMRDMTAGTTFLVSVNSAEEQGQPCAAPVVLSLDQQIEVQADAAEAAGIAIAAAAAGADDISTRPTISDDGQVVAFVSDVCHLVPEQPQMAGFDGVIVRWTRQPLPPQL